jgi:uncharacterized SAM-binding protein YcdF (DUF218 family)
MKKRHILVSLAVLCMIASLLWHEPVLAQMGRWLNVGEAPRFADYVMVLPGGHDQRPFLAAAIIRAGLAHGVLTAETETDASNDEGLNPLNDDVLRHILLLRGIREDQIHVLPGHSNSTWTDALSLVQFLREHPQSTVAIVTHDFHTRRSRWVFQRVLGNDAHRVFFVSCPLDRVDADSWWKTERGLTIYLSEYLKLIIYRGSDSWTILSAIVISGLIGGFLLGRRPLCPPPPRPKGSRQTSADLPG